MATVKWIKMLLPSRQHTAPNDEQVPVASLLISPLDLGLLSHHAVLTPRHGMPWMQSTHIAS